MQNDYLKNRAKEKARNDSSGTFAQSKTPIFNENSLSPEQNSISPNQTLKNQRKKESSKDHKEAAGDSSKDQISAAEQMVKQQREYLRSLKPLRNIDIFETMEKEMK